MTSRFLSVAEVVRLTGLSERTVRMMISDGRLPVIRPDGLRVVRVPESAVEKLMQART
jgi:excisionase family DNA binding protein